MFGLPDAGPPRALALLVVAAVTVGIVFALWLFGAMT